MTTPIASIDNTTLLNLTNNLDIGDVADPALRLIYFQYLNMYIQTITTAFNAFVANGSVGTANLADLSVTPGKLADLSVITAKLNDLAVTAAKIADSTIPLSKMDLASIDSRYYTEAETDAMVSVKANSADVYTKEELTPYLQGGETSIKYEVYTIVNSNNGDGTFTYKDVNDVSTIGTLTAEGYQAFTLLNGFYNVGMNRVEMVINDTLQRSAASGGLVELSETSVALAVPEGAGAEITIKYYERIGLTGEHSLIVGSDTPINTDGNLVWFKIL